MERGGHVAKLSRGRTETWAEGMSHSSVQVKTENQFQEQTEDWKGQGWRGRGWRGRGWSGQELLITLSSGEAGILAFFWV